MEESLCDLGFSLCRGIGPKRYSELIRYFGSSQDAWLASYDRLASLLGKTYASVFDEFRKTFSPTTVLKRLQKKGIVVIGYSDKRYPEPLKRIPTPPIVLYALGNIGLLTLSDRCIGIVGTRKVTQYGRQVTISFTRELVESECVILSGLALGVDAIAHTVTLQNHGKTIAVLGNGVDLCHPESNRIIYDAILQKEGLLLSEYFMGIPPSTGSFPARNRIIAGLSRGIVVTEGSEDSGSLITAKYAISFGRNVYAVPGPITSTQSAGPNKLLKHGAIFVTSGNDILHDLSMDKPTETKEIKAESEEEQLIIDCLRNETLSFDDIVRKSELDPGMVSVTLSHLELKRYVSLEEGVYSLIA